MRFCKNAIELNNLLIGDLGFDDSDRPPLVMPILAISRTKGCENFVGGKCTECIQLPNSYQFILN